MKNTKKPSDIARAGVEIKHFIKKIPLGVWWLGVLIFGAFIFQTAFNSFSTIEYGGMTFTRERLGDLLFYHHSYYIDAQTKYNLYLRTDPSENSIPLNTANVVFTSNKVYISINETDLSSCKDASIAVAQLSSFLSLNKLTPAPATPDPTQSLADNRTLASCATPLSKPIIVVQKGTTSQVVQKNPSCYELHIAQCEDFVPVVERFIVEAIREARNRD